MSHYRVRNWSEYNKGLKQRGSLTFWISPDVLSNWEVKQKTGKPGATPTYSNQAIVTMVSLKSVMSLPGRALCGFVESIFKPTSGKRHVVIDSTGIKVYGEGEWKTRQHGISKRRTWRKLHLAVDEATGEILSGVVTDTVAMIVKSSASYWTR